MRKFILKLKRLEVRRERKIFDAKKTLEDGTSNDRFSKLFSISQSE